MDENSSWLEGDEHVERMMLQYYERLFTSSYPSEFEEILDAVQHKVTQRMNQALVREFSEVEVKNALKQMYPLKSPGLDGMPPLFYQHFLPKIGGVVTSLVLAFLNSAYEMMHRISQKKSGRVGDLALKLDMSKAYDRINGKPKGHIIPSRGIRQGDPLSPYLFLLCAEGLSALIKKEVKNGSANTSIDIQEAIKERFGAQVIKHHEKYLGLPSLVGRNKKNTFNSIKDKLRKKLVGWKEKLLSKAGKEVLIKAVA
ncbi:uncharacterized protein LOC112010024 [Quercus suber]|uniref:uncharacterized protein LOC112010024 n=1 Tax=Quercus suber TaxID=58331 RepID=UPI000CE1C367|nr:uncharacterized protein LOC112010024 [Quercus suber]